VNGGRATLSGSGSAERQTAAAPSAKRQQTAKRQPAANVRQEANVKIDARHD
jgi:hypothetical protein